MLLFAAGLLAGCNLNQSADERDERDPYLRRARELKNLQNFDGAIEMYNKALDRRPGLARAHLEVGLIYDQQLHDDVRAIYHYERYLEIRPDAEKKKIVEELIRHAQISFASSLPDRPKEAIREIDMMKKEIATLKSLLAESQGTARSVTSPTTLTTKVAATELAAAVTTTQVSAPTPPAPPEYYTVVAGDTLSRIATKVYNDSNRWKDILDANRNQLSGPQSLRQGQKLVIPRKP